MSDEENEEFFDANDYFDEEFNVKKSNENKEKDNNETKEKNESTSSGYGLDSISNVWQIISHKLYKKDSSVEPIKTKSDEMVIAIKEQTDSTENTGKRLDSKTNEEKKKMTKIEIISENEKSIGNSDKNSNKFVIDERVAQIKADDIEMSACHSIKFLINVIAVQILGCFILTGTGHWIYNYLEGIDWFLRDKTYFNFHIFFMSLGICSFGTGLLIHRMFRGWSLSSLNCLHTTLTLMTLIFVLIGFYAMIRTLHSLDSVHFYTVHSWIGLLSIIAFTVEWISGVVIFIFPRFITPIQLLIIPIHSFLGRLTFTLVCGTAITGISDKLRLSDENIKLGPYEKWYHTKQNRTIMIERDVNGFWVMPKEALLCNIISIVILLYALFVNYLSSNDNFKRRLLPQELGIEVVSKIKK